MCSSPSLSGNAIYDTMIKNMGVALYWNSSHAHARTRTQTHTNTHTHTRARVCWESLSHTVNYTSYGFITDISLEIEKDAYTQTDQ